MCNVVEDASLAFLALAFVKKNLFESQINPILLDCLYRMDIM